MAKINKATTSEDITIEYFIKEMMRKIVSFFVIKVEDEFGEKDKKVEKEALKRAINIVTSTAFVTAEKFNNSRIFLYALDPLAFLPINNMGKCELWDYLQIWAGTKNITLGISQYKLSFRGGKEIYKWTKNYLLSLQSIIDNGLFTFEQVFFEDKAF